MNTVGEIADALEGHGNGDRAPPAIFTQTATGDQMEHTSWPEAHYDAEKMADLSLQLHRMFGLSTAKVPFCLTVETERFGCHVDRGDRTRQPSVVSPLVPADDGPVPEVSITMEPDEFVTGGRCSTVIEAAGILKKTEEVFVVSGTFDPFGISNQLMGIERFLMGMLMEPENTRKWTDAVTPFVMEYCKRLSEVSDDVQIVAEAATDILPPDMFDDYVGKPVGKTVASAGCFTSVHSCGDTSDILGKLSSLGETALSVESPSGPEDVLEKLDGRVRAIGGIDPVRTLLSGCPEDVLRSAERYSDAGYDLIAPECGVPPTAPAANVRMLSEYRTLL
ncbi:MAG: hypothetical protein MJZ68_03215 [archaeon]|nr:hypothetical protein [archaeon]